MRALLGVGLQVLIVGSWAQSWGSAGYWNQEYTAQVQQVTQYRYIRVHSTGTSGYSVQVHQGTRSSGTVGYKVQIQQGAQYRYIRLHSTGTSGYT